MPAPPRHPPPADQAELIERARAAAGLELGQLAAHLGCPVPADLRREKGWVGQLLEAWLGADALSLAEPDFRALGIELKTLPVDRRGLPRESTYVCHLPLEGNVSEPWEQCWLRRKLARVLWLPVEAAADIPLARRRVGTAILWSPTPEEEQVLRTDWEELMELVCLGELERITAHLGSALQIRPKAAHSRVLAPAVGRDGERILTNPRGFYLRPSFTAAILRRHFGRDG